MWRPALAGPGHAVTLMNARVVTDAGIASSIRFRSTVLAFDERPGRADAVVDLQGAFVLPGLINAHDHLELNHFGRLKRRDRYANAAEWIDDLRPVIRADADVRRALAHPLRDRLFIGGLKNLLSGVTTVAHHNPLYRGIARSVPVRVVRRFGWAHSLTMEGEPVGANGETAGAVDREFRRTPRRYPFVIHAAEGIDAAAAAEIDRLQAIGCLGANTVLVHGVALTAARWRALVDAGASLVWCPQSNDFLFGRTAPVRELLDAAPAARQRICLATDSRVTGSRDLLDELRFARSVAAIGERELLDMVTRAPAQALRLGGKGTLAAGGPADLIVVPATSDAPAAALVRTRRSDLELVVVGGAPAVGTARFCGAFAARHVRTATIAVDGAARLADLRLASRIRGCAIQEPGVGCA
ncbi:MAG TPA: amidohydrolase family protein [Vicinamibacterales bacterium]|jgi:cytosine/adenosine deaminase-related metal-dependent hydrolase